MTRLTEQPAEGTERTAAVIARVADTLAAAGVASPRADAELLTAYVLGVPRSRLVLAAGVTGAHRARLEELVGRRVDRVPVQHLTGRAGFRHLDLAVGPGVFIPRPETESLAGWGIEALTVGPPADLAGPAEERTGRAADLAADLAGPVVVDLCGGSGAIALAVANEVPAARVYVVEADPAALDWLRRNAAERAAAGDRPVRVVPADVTAPDLLDGPLAELRGRVDLVLCNPPYVPLDTPVPPEVATGDPRRAVFGGPDGLEVIGPVIALAAGLLRPGGAVGIEHDESHAPEVLALLRQNGHFAEIVGHPDLAGRPRFATASRLHGKLHP